MTSHGLRRERREFRVIARGFAVPGRRLWGGVSAEGVCVLGRRESFVGLLLLGLMTACGGGGNNDQGIVFTATGVFRGPEAIEDGQIRCQEPTVQNAIIDTAFTLDISRTIDFPDRNNPLADPCGGYIGLQNNLATQSILVSEVAFHYEIPGAAIAIPTHSVSTGLRINSASSTAEASSGQSNLVFAEMVGQIIPAQMINFLNQNANLLPAVPYTLNVFMMAQGQADSGANYTSNELGYTITIIR